MSSLTLISALKVQVFHLVKEKPVKVFITYPDDEDDPDQKRGNSKGKNLSQL